MKVALIQSKVSDSKKLNNENISKKIIDASNNHVDMVVLSEMFNCPYDVNLFGEYAEDEKGSTLKLMSSLSKDLSIYIVAGSISEICDNNVYNTTYVFNREGKIISKHRKVHLFDINIKGGQFFKESETLTSGEGISYFDTEFGRIGHMICFDVRFAGYAKQLADVGCKAVVVPGNFNMTTGPAHWELIFRSRALDNQMYYLGCASSRNENSSYINYGNSIITNPYGEVVARLDDKEATLYYELDFEYLESIREQIPVIKNTKKHDLL